jgi:hypothetical protein
VARIADRSSAYRHCSNRALTYFMF